MRIATHRSYRFPVGVSDVWTALAAVEAYPTWWPWLRQFEARALADREVWACTIRPPLPYAIRCRVELVDVRPRAAVAARLSGDIVGHARVELAGDGVGTEVRVTSHLEARSVPARLLGRTAPALARWGHDWVFDTAARQFGAAVLGEAPGPAAP